MNDTFGKVYCQRGGGMVGGVGMEVFAKEKKETSEKDGIITYFMYGILCCL